MKSKQVMIILIAILVCLGLISLYIVDFFRNPFIPNSILMKSIERQSSIDLQLIPDESASVLSLRFTNNTDYMYKYFSTLIFLQRDWIYRWRPPPPYRLDYFAFQDMGFHLHPNSYVELVDIPFELFDDLPNGEYILFKYAWRYGQRNSFRVAVRFSLPLNLN